MLLKPRDALKAILGSLLHTHLYAKLDEFGKISMLQYRSELVMCQYLNVHHQPAPTTCTSLEWVNPQLASITLGLENPQQAAITSPGLVNLGHFFLATDANSGCYCHHFGSGAPPAWEKSYLSLLPLAPWYSLP